MSDDCGTISVEDDFWAKDSDLDLNFTKALMALQEERLKFPSYSARPSFKDFMAMRGMYLPPPGREYYYDKLDIRNDGLPQNCSLVGMGDFFRHFEQFGRCWGGYASGSPSMSGVVITVQKRTPKECRVILKKDPVYKMTLWEYFEDGIPERFIDGEAANKAIVGGKIVPDTDFTCIRSISEYFQVSRRSEGELIPCVVPNRDQLKMEYLRRWVAWTNCAHYDKKHLWRVYLASRYKGTIHGVLEFGVDEEKVKSILYARDSPVTIDGRRQPIMHWVSSHKRRIKAGIDININKHLRGVNQFNMFGHDFFIAHPAKKGSEAQLDELESFYDAIDRAPEIYNLRDKT